MQTTYFESQGTADNLHIARPSAFRATGLSSSSAASAILLARSKSATSIVWGLGPEMITIPHSGQMEILSSQGQRLRAFSVHQGDQINLSMLGVSPGSFWIIKPNHE